VRARHRTHKLVVNQELSPLRVRALYVDQDVFLYLYERGPHFTALGIV